MQWDGHYMAASALSLRLTPAGHLAADMTGSGEPQEISREALDVLLAFHRPRTPGQVFAKLTEEWEVDRSEFDGLVSQWVADGWLQPIVAATGRPGRLEVFRQAMEIWIAAGRRMVFPLQSPLPLQRPGIYYPGLDSREVHDGRRFPWVAQLEAAAPVIAEELSALLRERRGFSEVYKELTTEGRWAGAYLYIYGERIAEICDRCPETARLVQAIPGGSTELGKVFFSALAPRTYLTPHCGTSNVKLRCQLPLRVPAGCALRVGEQTVRLEEGKCIVFDDSFSHTAWNDSDQPRFILLFDFYHPDLTPEEIEYLIRVGVLDVARRAHPDQMDTKDVPEWVYA